VASIPLNGIGHCKGSKKNPQRLAYSKSIKFRAAPESTNAMTEYDDKEQIKAPYPHITTRGSVPTHYYARLRSHTLPHEAPSPHITTRASVPTHYHARLRPPTLPREAPSTHITTRGSIQTHYHTRLRPHTLPHEAPSPHITTRGSVPTHYHARLHPHTLPHEAPSPHIITRGSVPTHYHMRLRPPTLPHEAPSTHITTRGSVPPHYHTRLRPHTLLHEAPSPHITTRGSLPTHYHTRLRPHTLPHEAPSTHITTRGSVPTHYHTRLRPRTLPHEALSSHISSGHGTDLYRASMGQYECSRAHVIKKFKAHGTVANLPRCGRKRKIDKRFQRKIVQMLDKEPRLTSKQVQATLQSEGTTVSTRTIHRHLNEKGLYGRRPRKTPLFTPRHKKASLEFAKTYLKSLKHFGRMFSGQMRQK
ncbi:unnamed protein product, partial [Ranitomeya imitator]